MAGSHTGSGVALAYPAFSLDRAAIQSWRSKGTLKGEGADDLLQTRVVRRAWSQQRTIQSNYGDRPMRTIKIILTWRGLGFAIALISGAWWSSPTHAQTWIDIDSPQELALIGHDASYPLHANYRLTQNISLADIAWDPIGDQGDHPFTGIFDGQGFTISNFEFSDSESCGSSCPCSIGGGPEVKPVGLFSVVSGADGTGHVHNVILHGVSINVPYRGTIGALVGWVRDGGWIHNCHVSRGTVLGRCETGGLIGRIEGPESGEGLAAVSDCSSSVTVSNAWFAPSQPIEGKWHGGLIGHTHLYTHVVGCTSSGPVYGVHLVGGLAGNLHGSTMLQCSSSSTVWGHNFAGGLVGYIESESDILTSITLCSASGNVATSPTLLGWTVAGGRVPSDGGLVGYVEGTNFMQNPPPLASRIRSCTASGNVTTGHTSIFMSKGSGGLVGWAEGGTIVEYCSASGDVTGNTCGGLVGYAEDDVSNSSAQGEVHGIHQTGGLIGAADPPNDTDTLQIRDCWAESPLVHSTGGVTNNGHTTSGHNFASVGGLVGYAFPGAQIFRSWADCNVSSDVGEFTGGLVGLLLGAELDRCYALGSVTAHDGRLGGLVGGTGTLGSAAIEDCYANAVVTYEPVDPSQYPGYPPVAAGIGGLIGAIKASGASEIERTYAAGPINAHSSAASFVGGLVGTNASSLTLNTSYWDYQSTGYTVSAGGQSRSTAQMQDQTNYVSWSFPCPWKMPTPPAVGYPFLDLICLP